MAARQVRSKLYDHSVANSQGKPSQTHPHTVRDGFPSQRIRPERASASLLADESPPDGVKGTRDGDGNGGKTRVGQAGLTSFASPPQVRRHPFRQEVSAANRTSMEHHFQSGKADEEWHKSEQFLISLSKQMGEVNRRLHNLQLGQDDIHAWVQQMRHDVTRSTRAHHETRVLHSASIGTKSHVALSDKADDSPDCDNSSSVGADEKSVGAASAEEAPPYQMRESLHVYCGCELREEVFGLRESVGRSSAFDALLEEGKQPEQHALTLNDLSLASIHFRTGVLPCLPRPKAIHPDSAVRLGLDLGSMTVLLFDSVSVPYQLSFEPDASSGFWFVTNWLTLFVWTIDIFLGFFSGYYDQGGPELRLRKIAKRYIRSFFFIDLATVCCDWVGILLTTVMESNPSNVMLLKSFRILKLNRLLRLMGALQSGKFGQMYDRIVNLARQIGFAHQLEFLWSVVQLMAAILWLNHIGCCLWYAIQTDMLLNWELDSNIMEYNDDVQAADWLYFLGFYWSMTSMVSGSSIMSPTDVPELAFTILYVLFGLLVGSTLISSLAAMLLDLQMSNKEKSDNLKLLRQYLYQQGLTGGLSLDVEKEVVARMSQEKRLGASDVPCLGLLSPAMRTALHYAVYCKPLKAHPFLGVCHILDSSGLFTKEICNEAIEHDTQLPGFQVFPSLEHGGDKCEGPIYVVIGELEYLVKESDILNISTASDTQDVSKPLVSPSIDNLSQLAKPTMVSAGQWLCELATWLQWSYRGSLNACIPCEYLRMNAQVLLNIFMKVHLKELRWLAWQYGTALCKAMDKEELDQLTDLPLREDLHYSVVLSMSMEGRQRMSVGPLKLLKTSNKKLSFLRGPYSKLVDQVNKGKCDLVIQDGRVMRIVSVVTLRITREVEKDGKNVRQILAQISRSTNTHNAKCQLPGGKVHAGELPTDALVRILQEQLYALSLAGLTPAGLQKAENVVELTKEAKPGDRELEVSSLGELHDGSLIHISGNFGSETQVVDSLDVVNKLIEIGRPLEYHYGIGAHIAKAGEKKGVKAGVTSSDSLGVDTKYIKTVFCATLSESDRVGKALRRDRPVLSDVASETLDSDPATEYSALLLFPGRRTNGDASTNVSGVDIGMGNDDNGILCAWMDEKDYVALSTMKDGTERVKRWVGELQTSIQETLNDERISQSAALQQDAEHSLPVEGANFQDGEDNKAACTDSTTLETANMRVGAI